MHPLRLYRLPQRVGGGWWLSRIAGSQEIAAELMPGYEIGFNRSRRRVTVQTKGGPPLTVDEAIKRGVIRLLEPGE